MLMSMNSLIGAALAGTLAAATPPDTSRHAQVTLDVRLVQVDLGRIAEIEAAEGAAVRASEKWGLEWGLSFDGRLRSKPLVLMLGDDGELRIGDRVWRLGAALDDAGAGIERPDSPFTVLVAPRVTCRIGQEAVISIGSPVEHMIPGDDGCLRLASGKEDGVETEGVLIRMRATEIVDGNVTLDPIQIGLRRVVGREPIDGVPLEIGRPIMREDRVERDLRLDGDRVAVMLLTPLDDESEGPILVVISRGRER